jgi:hypothetical protein
VNPNEALTDARQAIRRQEEAARGGSNDEEIEAGHELAEAFAALDDWMSGGSAYLPADWERQSSPAVREAIAKIDEAGAHKTCGDPDCYLPEHDREWVKAARAVVEAWETGLYSGRLGAAIFHLREVTPR